MLKFTFPKSSRLLAAKDFFNVLRNDEVYSGKFLKIYSSEKAYLKRRLGITVSKRYGKAHRRNRFKRLVREAFRLLQHDLPRHIQLNVYPLKKAEEISLQDIQADFLNFRDSRRIQID